MKSVYKKSLFTLSTLSIGFIFAGLAALTTIAQAGEIDLTKDFDSLGGNEGLMKKARDLDPNNRVMIVQKRVVDRHYRLEMGVNYGGFVGGDSYTQSQSLGGTFDFHINPHWSVGARMFHYYNSLTPEGKMVFDNAKKEKESGNSNYDLPSIDYPKDSLIGVVSFYPVYGKLNLFDLAVTQFDMYMLGGAGSMHLDSGYTPTITAGGGVGFWWTQHLASRIEARWQTYSDKSYQGNRRLNIGVITFSLGILL